MTPAVKRTRRTGRQRIVRFASVSAVTAPLGQLCIFLFYNLAGLNGVLANGTAVVVVSIVGYFLSTLFVWDSDPGRRLRYEVPMFWTLSLTGFVVSTAIVAIAVAVSDHPLAVNLASGASYAVVWLARFVILDRLVFAPMVAEA